jgi:precorrin-6B methylase 2
MERIPIYLRLSERVPGWTRGPEAEALIRAAYALPDGAVIVEIGAFLGSGSILLAGARKLRRSGRVHCVDPFDASGDAFSVPHYQRILGDYPGNTQIQLFRHHLRKAGLTDWYTLHEGTAQQIGLGWNTGIDLLFMDGDQSLEGVLLAYQTWQQWLNAHGLLVLHNSNSDNYSPGHDGHFRLRERLLAGSDYELVEVAGSTSFFRKKATEPKPSGSALNPAA